MNENGGQHGKRNKNTRGNGSRSQEDGGNERSRGQPAGDKGKSEVQAKQVKRSYTEAGAHQMGGEGKRMSSSERSRGKPQSSQQRDRYDNTQHHSNCEKDLAQKHQMKEKWQNHPRENVISGRPLKRFSRVSFVSSPYPDVLKHLQLCLKSKRIVTKVLLKELIQKSIAFWDTFPAQAARLHILKEAGQKDSMLEEFLNSVYPIVHHSTPKLMLDFLDHKLKFGSNVERKFYEGMDLISFVDRLLKRRPLSFLGANDQYLLPSLKHGYGNFESIGTEREQRPLTLEDFLSYDEMRISALISLSSWSVFVNDGRRKNNGVVDKPGSFQSTGVICGQVGARLKKEGVMEYLDCVIAREENTVKKGFGSSNTSHINSVWGKLWGHHLPTHAEAMEAFRNKRDNLENSSEETCFEYIPLGDEFLFNVTVYKKRIFITAEILLCEAASRAEAAGKQAYVHVVGLGLGVWRASNKQDELFVEAWGDALCSITNTDHIAYVDFSYIDARSVHGIIDGEKFPNTKITIRFSNRQLHDKVPNDCILVCNYAWDGNSLPGNEFWLGKVCSTGDSAAACSSCVAEIHNHLINPAVSGDALRVSTKEGRVVPWHDYAVSAGESVAVNVKPAPVLKPATVVKSASVFEIKTQTPTPAPSNTVVNAPEPTPSAIAITNVPLSQPPLDMGSWSAKSHADFNASKNQSPVPSLSTSKMISPIKTPTVAASAILKDTPTAAKKSRQEEPEEQSSGVEVVVPKQVEVPAKIPHATIVGLFIDNPNYKTPPKPKKPKNSSDKSTAAKTPNTAPEKKEHKQGGGNKNKETKNSGEIKAKEKNKANDPPKFVGSQHSNKSKKGKKK